MAAPAPKASRRPVPGVRLMEGKRHAKCLYPPRHLALRLQLSPVRIRPDAGTDLPPRGRPSLNCSTTVTIGTAPDVNRGHAALSEVHYASTY
jgi:hypothetical protein